MTELALEYFVQAVEGSQHDLPGVARCVQLQLLVESLGGKCPQLLDLGVELRELGSGIFYHVGMLLTRASRSAGVSGRCCCCSGSC